MPRWVRPTRYVRLPQIQPPRSIEPTWSPLFEKARKIGIFSLSCSEPSFQAEPHLTRLAKPRPQNGLSEKLSCSFQAPEGAAADRGAAGAHGCALPLRGAGHGTAADSRGALGAIVSGCRGRLADTTGRSGVSAGDKRGAGDAGSLLGCRQPAADDTWKGEKTVGSRDSDGLKSNALLRDPAMNLSGESKRSAASKI